MVKYSPIKCHIIANPIFGESRLGFEGIQEKAGFKGIRFHHAITAFFLRILGKKIVDIKDADGKIYHLNRGSLEGWFNSHTNENLGILTAKGMRKLLNEIARKESPEIIIKKCDIRIKLSHLYEDLRISRSEQEKSAKREEIAELIKEEDNLNKSEFAKELKFDQDENKIKSELIHKPKDVSEEEFEKENEIILSKKDSDEMKNIPFAVQIVINRLIKQLNQRVSHGAFEWKFDKLIDKKDNHTILQELKKRGYIYDYLPKETSLEKYLIFVKSKDKVIKEQDLGITPYEMARFKKNT